MKCESLKPCASPHSQELVRVGLEPRVSDSGALVRGQDAKLTFLGNLGFRWKAMA